MGQAKRDRTEMLFKEAKKILIAEQVQNDIEQFRFNKLLEMGVIVKVINEKQMFSCLI